MKRTGRRLQLQRTTLVELTATQLRRVDGAGGGRNQIYKTNTCLGV